MAAQDAGWVRLWRKSLGSVVFADDGLWQIFCWCLLKATYEPRTVPVRTGRGCTTVVLEPGQFIFGRYTASGDLGLKPSTTWGRMHRLCALGVITIKSNTHFSVITLVNWRQYQADEVGNADTQPDTQPDTNKKLRSKEVKKKRARATFVKPTIEEVATYCRDRGKGIDPQAWLDHYEANGWRVGRNAMKNWQAAIRTWERNGVAVGRQPEKPDHLKPLGVAPGWVPPPDYERSDP